MSWNYRVVKYANNEGFGLHEVYYDAKGKIDGWTEDPILTCSADEVPEIEFIKEFKAMTRDIENEAFLEEEELSDTKVITDQDDEWDDDPT